MQSVSFKTNRVIHILCIAFLLIAVRVLHLGVVQREDKLKEAEKPKLRSILLRADRGEICDRFHIPLATNRICYNAAIYYSQINQLPYKGWKTDAEGHRVRTYPRKEHVQNLSQLLGGILHLDAGRIEDLIYAKASLLPHVPFILKTNLNENEFYQLKILEKDWPGLYGEIGSERHYPLGKVGCHILGTLGAISQKQFTSIAQEIHEMQDVITAYETLSSLATLPSGYESIEEVYERLDTLKDKAYTLNDKVGKSGIEGKFEEDLRGRFGVRALEVNNQGKPIRELPNGKTPVAGKKIVLSISSELQQFAEELLIQSEKDRDGTSLGIDPLDKTRKAQKQPWIKGGAIVALNPKTGELLAFASHPRFDPNDFIGNGRQIRTFRWLENERMIGDLWDGKEALSRERLIGGTKKSQEEQKIITWDFYLDQILPKDGPLRTFFEKADDIKSAVQIQEDYQALLYFSKCSDPRLLMEALTTKNSTLGESLRSCEDASLHLRRIETWVHPIPSAEDRLFAIDLCRLCIFSPRFGDELLAKIGQMKISTYRALNQAFCRLSKKKKEEAFKEFHTSTFSNWRAIHQKEFLTKKRAEEKEQKTYARPYIDYLDQKERELFQSYWEEHGISIFMEYLESASTDPDKELLQKTVCTLPQGLGEELLRTFRSFENLDRPLFLQTRKWKTEKDLASAFYPAGNIGYSRSYAFQTGVPQGSVFKLVSSYEGLKQGLSFSMIDEQSIDPSAPAGKNLIVGYSINKTPYHRLYKGGRLPKTAALQVGKIDLVGAIESSSNPYFSILAGDYMKSPEDLNEAASLFGYGSKTGIDLFAECGGNLPSDLKTNRTGLYSYAIGQHTLLCTPLQSALMLSALANGGHLLKPQVIKNIIDPGFEQEPMQTEPHIIRSLWMPESIRHTIFEGMDKCVWSNKGCARPSGIKALHANHILMRDYLLLQHQMIGKTGTAEILYNPGRYPSSKAQMYKHIWFGSIAFQGDTNSLSPSKTLWEHPELVVVVFLRFGSGGKAAAPLAAQMIHKWREISKRHAL